MSWRTGQTHIREAFATANMLTLVRLLAGVRSDMNGQGTPLDEALTTTRSRASVWALIGVNTVVPLKV